MTRTRVLIALGVAAALVVLFLLVRPGGEGTRPAQPPQLEAVTTGTEEDQGETGPQPPPPAENRLEIRIAEGRPVGGIHRLRVSQGDRVIIEVRSDAADEVHVHGYDLTQEIAPQVPARLAFDATTTGRFEIELHDAGRQIAELTVEP